METRGPALSVAREHGGDLVPLGDIYDKLHRHSGRLVDRFAQPPHHGVAHLRGRRLGKTGDRGVRAKRSDEIAVAQNADHGVERGVMDIFGRLRADLAAINYSNLNVDKEGLRKIMDLAVEGGILQEAIDIDDFTDDSFSTEITKTDQ